MRFGKKVLLGILLLAFGLAVAGCGWQSPTDGDAQQSLASDVQAAKTPPPPILHPVVTLRTTLGELTIELDAEHAPLTVANFLAYVDRGQYDQTIFHQVQPGFVALGGGYTRELVEKPVQPGVRNEADNGLKNRRGTIAMARCSDVIDSATGQFFLNLADNTALDYRGRSAEEYGYCVFGQVVSGQDVLDKLGQLQVRDKPQFEKLPVETVLIESARRVR